MFDNENKKYYNKIHFGCVNFEGTKEYEDLLDELEKADEIDDDELDTFITEDF